MRVGAYCNRKAVLLEEEVSVTAAARFIHEEGKDWRGQSFCIRVEIFGSHRFCRGILRHITQGLTALLGGDYFISCYCFV